ncbi:hypothetical protein LUZ60_006267 [Juncus effusus]|nr:hypothetical protein LUZ60_006267 [Juncus effusus]
MYRRLSSAVRTPPHSSSSSSSPDPKLSFLYDQLQKTVSPNKPLQSKPENSETKELRKEEKEVVISHPWPEWAGLIEILVRKEYVNRVGLEDPNRVRTACLQFARDKPGLIRYLSREEIHTVANFGCPTVDRKVVNSSKRLRAHVGIDEGEVCSRCSLRGNCDRAYVKAREEEGFAKTIDIMRVLLTYGLDFITGSVQNGSCLTKPVKQSVKRLTREIVGLDSSDENCNEFGRVFYRSNNNENKMDKHTVPTRQGDWICPKCKFMNFAKNLKCLKCSSESEERYNVYCEDQENLPLKPGDWICQKCNFLNFAKNTECLQCHEKPKNRLLNAGEWECESCNYVNFRRNEHCRKCGWKRPKLLNFENTASESELNNHSYDQNPKFSFVSNKKNIESSITYTSQRKTTEPKEELDLESWNHNNNRVAMCDFPIIGGKSVISRDSSERERWKEEMLRKNKGILTNENYEFSDYSCDIPKSMQLSESTDCEEMKSWFIHHSNNNNN